MTGIESGRTAESGVGLPGMATSSTAGERDEVLNVAAYLSSMAESQPSARAIVVADGYEAGKARWKSWTYQELNRESYRTANRLELLGVSRGMKVIVLIRPGIECFATIFALLNLAAVPVIIDPGMGVSAMAECLGRIGAEVFIGTPLAHVLRLLHWRQFRSIRVNVTIGRRWFWGGHSLRRLELYGGKPRPAVVVDRDETAAILFTTGSTGPAKPVVYSHGVFAAQFRLLRDHFGIRPGEVDLATFLLFGLFAPGLGMTAVLPDMDFTRPGAVDPRKIIGAIEEHRITNMFGSPALLDRVGRYGLEEGVKLPTLRRVITAGAPVRRDVLERFSAMLAPEAEIFTPYGATEALPVASIGSHELLGDADRTSATISMPSVSPPAQPSTPPQSRIQNPKSKIEFGVCVGRPLPGIDIRIIRITDEPIAQWSDDLLVPPGEIGEIAVRGPIVTREYFGNPKATALAKIPFDPTASAYVGTGTDSESGASVPRRHDFFHRMGDVGRFDQFGRLWMCGRKSHRVETSMGTLFTIPCEAVFNQHPRVRRTALVGIGPRGRQTPVLCVELNPRERGEFDADFERELMELGASLEHTHTIKTVLLHPRFPVDIRHNAKIFREKLAAWAARKLDRTVGQ